MKLNTKRTVLVGFAFLSICAFWQMYDNLIPKILTETFGIGESISGVVMAADNVLALFLLPLFGGLSDKCTSKLGRRRPFLLFGTLAAVVLMMALPLLTDSFHAAPASWKLVCFIAGLGLLLIAMGTYRSPAVALMPDVYIIEDDFESEFSVSSKPEDTLFALSDRDNVMYLNTFSKTISPSLRVGYMVLPQKLVKNFDEYLGFYSCTVPTFEQ